MLKKYEPGIKEVEERKARNKALVDFIVNKKGSYGAAKLLFNISRARAFQIVKRELEKAKKRENIMQ